MGLLRRRLSVLLLLAAVVPATLAAALGVAAVRRMSGLAQQQASAALRQEAGLRVLGLLEEQAKADDATFEAVRRFAANLASYVRWLYDHPDYFPPFLKGGTPLRSMPEGHLVNEKDTPVGVFVPRFAVPGTETWLEAGLLSFVDPLLAASGDGCPDAARAWVIAARGIVRVYPNQGFGHAGSPVGPAHDFTSDEPYQAAGPERNPSRGAIWTARYRDPAGEGWLVTAAVPIYDAAGQMRAVAGVDLRLEHVSQTILAAGAGRPDVSALLLDPQGCVLGSSDAVYRELGLAELALQPAHGEEPMPGRGAPIPLAASTLPDVRRLAAELAAAPEMGLLSYVGASGQCWLGQALLPSTGWRLCWSLPPEHLTTPASEVEKRIADLRLRYAAGLFLALALTGGTVAVAAAYAGRALTRPLGLLAEGTRRLAADLSYRLPDLGPDELGLLAREMNAMAGRLEASQADAVRHARLAEQERQGREVAVLDERNRLAREIHDTIAQGLAGVILQLDNAGELLREGGNNDASRHVRLATGLARSSLADARRSVWSLRPTPLLEGGLEQALAGLGHEHESRGLPVRLELHHPGRLPAEVEDALFRVAQEALANAARHSGAREVEMGLRRREAGQGDGARAGARVELSVRDAGKGFDPLALGPPGPESGFGLWAMRERMKGVGGTLDVASAPGEGTLILASAPAGEPDPPPPPARGGSQ